MKTVIGDLHLKPSNLAIAKQLFDLIEHDDRFKESNHLILLGDVYDTKAIIRSEAQNFLFNYLSSTRYEKISIIVGNHDYENLECQNSALDPLKYLNKVRLYNSQNIKFDYDDEDCLIAFIPYIHSNDVFIKILNENREQLKNTKYVFCHQGFMGFDLGGGILDDSGVDVTQLPQDVNFIVGHYHKSQSNGNVQYIGTPFSHSFGESNQQKQVFLIHNDTIKSVHTNLSQHYQMRYNSEIFIECNSDLEKLTLISDDLALSSINVKDSDSISIIVECKKIDQNKYSKEFFESLLKIKIENLKIRYKFIDDTQLIRIDESIGIESMLFSYLTINKKESLMNEGMRYLKNAGL